MAARPIIRLATLVAEFEASSAALDKARSNAKFVQVPRDALAHILIDHAEMLNTLREHGRVEYRGKEEPKGSEEQTQ